MVPLQSRSEIQEGQGSSPDGQRVDPRSGSDQAAIETAGWER